MSAQIIAFPRKNSRGLRGMTKAEATALNEHFRQVNLGNRNGDSADDAMRNLVAAVGRLRAEEIEIARLEQLKD